MKKRYTYGDSGKRFQGSEYGGRGRTDDANGYRHGHQRNYRGENSQKEGKEPHIGSSEQLQPITLSHARVYDDGENAEEQNIEGEFDGRHTQSRPVDDNDVEGVR